LLFGAGSQELALFLTDELKLEKQSTWNQLPKLHGFQLVTTSGPSVVLTRRYYNEMYAKFLHLMVVVVVALLGYYYLSFLLLIYSVCQQDYCKSNQLNS